ncbi:hypothetical protein CBR_g12608 [Chara braunii]|uniref:Tify domain-containing protein n=1 Tax=Chara braunii TaxID=69332 RepID=A0A388KSB6_CHABU|nr:hypothetical protein CBR_g12608 [Chara braunii]|eukprot:GBG72888.1 hypothetical protein CBR_g12608 [Chara braunii]
MSVDVNAELAVGQREPLDRGRPTSVASLPSRKRFRGQPVREGSNSSCVLDVMGAEEAVEGGKRAGSDISLGERSQSGAGGAANNIVNGGDGAGSQSRVESGGGGGGGAKGGGDPVRAYREAASPKEIASTHAMEVPSSGRGNNSMDIDGHSGWSSYLARMRAQEEWKMRNSVGGGKAAEGKECPVAAEAGAENGSMRCNLPGANTKGGAGFPRVTVPLWSGPLGQHTGYPIIPNWGMRDGDTSLDERQTHEQDSGEHVEERVLSLMEPQSGERCQDREESQGRGCRAGQKRGRVSDDNNNNGCSGGRRAPSGEEKDEADDKDAMDTDDGPALELTLGLSIGGSSLRSKSRNSKESHSQSVSRNALPGKSHSSNSSSSSSSSSKIGSVGMTKAVGGKAVGRGNEAAEEGGDGDAEFAGSLGTTAQTTSVERLSRQAHVHTHGAFEEPRGGGAVPVMVAGGEGMHASQGNSGGAHAHYPVLWQDQQRDSLPGNLYPVDDRADIGSAPDIAAAGHRGHSVPNLRQGAGPWTPTGRNVQAMASECGSVLWPGKDFTGGEDVKLKAQQVRTALQFKPGRDRDSTTAPAVTVAANGAGTWSNPDKGGARGSDAPGARYGPGGSSGGCMASSAQKVVGVNANTWGVALSPGVATPNGASQRLPFAMSANFADGKEAAAQVILQPSSGVVTACSQPCSGSPPLLVTAVNNQMVQPAVSPTGVPPTTGVEIPTVIVSGRGPSGAGPIGLKMDSMNLDSRADGVEVAMSFHQQQHLLHQQELIEEQRRHEIRQQQRQEARKKRKLVLQQKSTRKDDSEVRVAMPMGPQKAAGCVYAASVSGNGMWAVPVAKEESIGDSGGEGVVARAVPGGRDVGMEMLPSGIPLQVPVPSCWNVQPCEEAKNLSNGAGGGREDDLGSMKRLLMQMRDSQRAKRGGGNLSKPDENGLASSREVNGHNQGNNNTVQQMPTKSRLEQQEERRAGDSPLRAGSPGTGVSAANDEGEQGARELGHPSFGGAGAGPSGMACNNEWMRKVWGGQLARMFSGVHKVPSASAIALPGMEDASFPPTSKPGGNPAGQGRGDEEVPSTGANAGGRGTGAQGLPDLNVRDSVHPMSGKLAESQEQGKELEKQREGEGEGEMTEPNAPGRGGKDAGNSGNAAGVDHHGMDVDGRSGGGASRGGKRSEKEDAKDVGKNGRSKEDASSCRNGKAVQTSQAAPAPSCQAVGSNGAGTASQSPTGNGTAAVASNPLASPSAGVSGGMHASAGGALMMPPPPFPIFPFPPLPMSLPTLSPSSVRNMFPFPCPMFPRNPAPPPGGDRSGSQENLPSCPLPMPPQAPVPFPFSFNPFTMFPGDQAGPWASVARHAISSHAPGSASSGLHSSFPSGTNVGGSKHGSSAAAAAAASAVGNDPSPTKWIPPNGGRSDGGKSPPAGSGSADVGRPAPVPPVSPTAARLTASSQGLIGSKVGNGFTSVRPQPGIGFRPSQQNTSALPLALPLPGREYRSKDNKGSDVGSGLIGGRDDGDAAQTSAFERLRGSGAGSRSLSSSPRRASSPVETVSARTRSDCAEEEVGGAAESGSTGQAADEQDQDSACRTKAAPQLHSGSTSGASSHRVSSSPQRGSELKKDDEQDTATVNNEAGKLSVAADCVTGDRHPVAWEPQSSSQRTTTEGLPGVIMATALRPGLSAEQTFGGSGQSPDLPWVSCTGPGKTISGVLYSRGAGSVLIVCACHGSHLTPEDFTRHAGCEDVGNPGKSIVVGGPFPRIAGGAMMAQSGGASASPARSRGLESAVPYA